MHRIMKNLEVHVWQRGSKLCRNVLAGKDELLPPEIWRIILKEVLQAYVLDYLYIQRIYRRLNFYGGPCLHVVYGRNRLSEDLDFDNQAGLDLDHLAESLAQYFHKAFGYGDASAKIQHGEGGILRVTPSQVSRNR